MKRIFLTYILFLLFASCSTQYEIHSHTGTSIDVKTKVDSVVLSIIAPYQNALSEKMNEVLCYNSTKMIKGQPESILGNFVCDLCLETIGGDANICILNNGGLRSELPKGEITKGQIYELMPFENELVILELNKSEINDLLEYILVRGGEPFGGMRIVVSNNETISAKISGEELNEQESIKVLTSDYLANGGNKMNFFIGKEQYKLGLKLRDAIINYCFSKDTITSKLDNRMSYE